MTFIKTLSLIIHPHTHPHTHPCTQTHTRTHSLTRSDTHAQPHSRRHPQWLNFGYITMKSVLVVLPSSLSLSHTHLLSRSGHAHLLFIRFLPQWSVMNQSLMQNYLRKTKTLATWDQLIIWFDDFSMVQGILLFMKGRKLWQLLELSSNKVLTLKVPALDDFYLTITALLCPQDNSSS